MTQQDIIKDTIRKYEPTLIGVFGSYARGEQTSHSDLDLLVEFDVKVNLLDLVGLEQELTDLLGIKVDLITTRSVSEYIRPSINKDFISLL